MTERWALWLAGYELFFAGVALSIGAAGPAAFFALLTGLCLGRWASTI